MASRVGFGIKNKCLHLSMKHKIVAQKCLFFLSTAQPASATAPTHGGGTKFGTSYETRYINDFINFTRPAADIVEPLYYDYESNPSRSAYNQEYESGGLAGLGLNGPSSLSSADGGSSTPMVEEEVTRPPDIYPDPDQIYATFLNKSATKRNRFPGEENVIKVCE